MVSLDFFLSRKRNTANVAKERLKIIVAERRFSDTESLQYLPQLHKDLLKVICKYMKINPKMVSVQFEKKESDISILELNVTLLKTEEQHIFNKIEK